VVRPIWPVLAGLVAFVVTTAIANWIARSIWPDYAAAVPSRAYTLPMLLARLTAGMAATIGAGWLASKIEQARQPVGLWVGVSLLAVSLPWHVYIWPQYPSWYHLVWLGSVIPCAVLGEKLSRSRKF
jgi:hypothetical protein